MTAANTLAIFLLASLAVHTSAADWAHWRGPFLNGSTSETNLPSHWSKTDGVRWHVELPGPGAATPIISGDHVFVSSTDADAQTILAFAFDRRDGHLLWQHKIDDGMGHHDNSNYASPSPVTDGKLVVFVYGNGDLAAFDFAGNELWRRNLQKDYGDFAYQWTYGASPTLYNGKLYVQVLQRNVPVHGRGRTDRPIDSFLLALEPAMGKTLWQHVRPCEAVEESHEAYTTPIPFTCNHRAEILIAGGDCVTGHDPETGAELWRWGTWNPEKIGHWRLVPSPVTGDGIILACAPKGSPVYAIKAGGTGTLGDAGIAWTSEHERNVSSDVPTPLFYLGDFFVLNEGRRGLSRVEPRTGKVKWNVPTPGTRRYETSPTGADGKIYFMNFAGLVVVADTADGRILSTVQMGDEGDDMIRSTIAVAHGELFIRTNHKLYCVGNR
ncbi:MAG: PQQ-binding-like beta-propeller repeat protein [Verrucomicrobia bacterium]|nr:PQQ-binding-like beta-propeller repeat protein [Verrucomicrobiota bacterium]